MTRAARYTITALFSPAFVAALFSILQISQAPEHLHSQMVNLIPLYFVFTYAFSIVPAAIAIALLYCWHYRRLWHFAAEGFLTGLTCILVALPLVADVMLVLLMIGPVVGGIAWIICEWRLFKNGYE